MKPDVKRILTKLSKNKVELSEAKAKALIKDFRKAESGMKSKIKILEKLDTEIKNIKKLESLVEKEINETGDFMEIYGRGKDKFNGIYDNFQKKAKELGIKVDQIPVMKELEKSFDDAADAYVAVSKINSKVLDFFLKI